jgi:hypothetical protein
MTAKNAKKQQKKAAKKVEVEVVAPAAEEGWEVAPKIKRNKNKGRVAEESYDSEDPVSDMED